MANSELGVILMALVGALIGWTLRVVFAVVLLLVLLPTIVISKLLGSLSPSGCGIISADTASGISLVCTGLSFWMALALAPWVRIQRADDMQAQWLALKAGMGGEQPTFILGNHTSFLDTIITISNCPLSVVWKTRTYFSGALVNMPVLGTLITVHQHFTVPFKGNKDGDFGVDKKAMAVVNAKVKAHVSSGGILAFFPEGQLNGDPNTLLPFRFGGMKTALEHDAKLWAFVTRGANICWPKTAQVGGFPCDGGYSLRPLAPSGARALVATIRKTDAKRWAKVKEDYEVLGVWTHETMQRQYDQLGSLGMFFDGDVDNARKAA